MEFAVGWKNKDWEQLNSRTTERWAWERTGEGRKRAQANGIKFGRKPNISGAKAPRCWRNVGRNREILRG